jgi:hypothetical protein
VTATDTTTADIPEALAEAPAPSWTPEPGKTLVLRTCTAELTSRGGFQWPSEGPIAAPDWDPKPECGNGLHGLLWGIGNGSLLDWSDDAKWLVVEVDASAVVEIDRKVKYPEGIVIYSGAREVAVQLIAAHAPNPSAVTANHAAATGHSGHAAATGHYGIAVALGAGSATTGQDGVVIARWTDPAGRPRVTVGYIGENGIEAGVAYSCNATGTLTPATAPTNNALAGIVADPTEPNQACKVINLARDRAKRTISAEAQA